MCVPTYRPRVRSAGSADNGPRKKESKKVQASKVPGTGTHLVADL